MIDMNAFGDFNIS